MWTAVARTARTSLVSRLSSSAKGKLRELPPPITVTERAAERIKELLSAKEGAIGIRLGVRRRGCNGLSYTMNYAEEAPKDDEEVREHGVRVFVDPLAVFHIVGTQMDFEETEMSAEFTFKNPQATAHCGCGESFTSVADA